ncbi:hypothetical protein I4U23_025774 [Adineta vaga]|nr:hypothetical protein I4U23_025774 [Adineta vaga]
MERISNQTNNENTDRIELPPPPPYTSAFYKTDEYIPDTHPPPTYTDVNGQSVVYINNYPGPPLTDGCVDINPEVPSVNSENILSKKIRIYLFINGIITILLGLGAIGIQIGMLASHSIIYYYYGFWAGVLLASIGINTIVLFRSHFHKIYLKLSHVFFWQTIFVGIILSIGIVIILTDKCDDNNTDIDNTKSPSCKSSYKILNGSLIAVFAVGFLQSIINTLFFAILYRQHCEFF